MAITKAEEFITELINNSDFQVEVLEKIKETAGSLDALIGTKDEKVVMQYAVPAANQLGYECTGDELKVAFDTVSKKAGAFKMIGFATNMLSNAKKVNEE